MGEFAEMKPFIRKGRTNVQAVQFTQSMADGDSPRPEGVVEIAGIEGFVGPSPLGPTPIQVNDWVVRGASGKLATYPNAVFQKLFVPSGE